MKLNNKFLLKNIFQYKNYLNTGHFPAPKIFDGIEIAPYKNNAMASICISTDFELNWAFRRHSEKVRDLNGSRSRNNIFPIIKLLEEFNIPITWATVGHLFLSNCTRGEDGLAHNKMSRPPRNDYWNGDWYKHDPCSNIQKDPLWYAPDLIEKIVESKVQHEIGTHSFSHIDFSPERSDRDLVAKEIKECISVMGAFGLRPKSLVFPHNLTNYSYLDIFSELGIVAIRHRDKNIRVSYPERTNHGVYKIYETMHLRSPDKYHFLDAFIIYLEEAILRHAVHHLWFHTSDPIEIFKNELFKVLEYISKVEYRNDLWITTMEDLACYCEARESLILKTNILPNEIQVSLESSLNHKRYGIPDISLVFFKITLPNNILVNINNEIVELKKDNYFKKRNDLVVNVPSNTTSLDLIF